MLKTIAITAAVALAAVAIANRIPQARKLLNGA
jgi:hypothetical protein